MSLELILKHQALLQKIIVISDAMCVCHLSVASKSVSHWCSKLKHDGKLAIGMVIANRNSLATKLRHAHVHSLKGLEFCANDLNIGAATVVILNAELEHLVMDSAGQSPSAGAMNTLFATFEVLRRIRIIHLSNMNIDQNKVKILADLLNDDKKLTELKADGCAITSHASYIFDSVAKNSTVKTLDMSANRIPYNLGGSIKQMLLANASLQTLVLAKNDLRSNGAVEVLDALASNATLTSLSLAANNVWTNPNGYCTDGTLGALTSALGANCALKTLSLDAYNGGGGRAVAGLCMALGRRGNFNIEM